MSSSFRIMLLLLMAAALLSCTRSVNEFSGVIVYGHEVRTVRLCGDSRLLWLHVTSEQKTQLERELQEMPPQPYREAYLEFTGSLINDPPGELAKEYDGTIRVDQILNFSTTIPEECGSSKSGQQTEPPPMPGTGRTYAFTCADGYNFIARTTETGQAWLFLPSGTVTLKAETAGTYLSESVALTIDGEQSQLQEPGGTHSCSNNRRQAIWEHAKLNGADFRAIGNEPGWNLEIRHQSKIFLVTNYGAEKNEFDLPEPEIDKANRTTRYNIDQDGQQVSLKISGEPCSDSMSGEQFESAVEVMINGSTLRGCGRALH